FVSVFSEIHLQKKLKFTSHPPMIFSALRRNLARATVGRRRTISYHEVVVWKNDRSDSKRSVVTTLSLPEVSASARHSLRKARVGSTSRRLRSSRTIRNSSHTSWMLSK